MSLFSDGSDTPILAQLACLLCDHDTGNSYATTGQDEKARAVMKAFLEKKPGLTI